MAEVTIHYTGTLVTREEARDANLSRYFTGLPCKHQHISQRLTCSSECVECAKRHKSKHRKPPITFKNRAFNFRDLIDKRFGRLVVLKAHHKTNYGATYWTCVCDCGTRKEIKGESLKSGAVLSCGCFLRANARLVNTRHGLSTSRVHGIWRNMRARCRNPRNHAYKHYGARGISVCERWNQFENFLEDMGHPPDGCSLEGIDNSGPYAPHNCVWATQFTQMSNTRRNVFLELNNKKLTISQWARELGFTFNLIKGRLNRGWTIQETLSTPRNRKIRHERI